MTRHGTEARCVPVRVSELRRIIEGEAELFVPRAPRIYDAPVFFNPIMRLNRDVSILCARILRPKTVLDAFSATGIRGIRYALEADAEEVWMNDISRDAFELMLKNSRLNFPRALQVGVGGRVVLIHGGSILVLSKEDANRLMSDKFRYFDLVDLDPFGSPVEYLDAALRSVKRKGVVAVTATDTGVLCGAYGRACLKKYLARPVRGELCHEAGLRILIGTIVRYAAKYDLGVEVVLAYYRDHYFRVFLRLRSGAKWALKSLGMLGYLYYTGPGRFEYETAFLPSREGAYGPMWMGKLKDEESVKRIHEECRNCGFIGRDTCEFIELLHEELDVPFFYDTHSLAREFGTQVPKVSTLIERLRELGFEATKTHLSPTAFKTTGGLADVMKAWRGG
ncbi:MAG: tRNA (guanine(10)-N(2))-dimethyltransferase [Thermococci archaeon]|nr:tRNA (guanine(10)-N(2))-dimethyltransferase [Thermococci archaeon]